MKLYAEKGKISQGEVAGTTGRSPWNPIPSMDLINPTTLIMIKLKLVTFRLSSWFLKSYLHKYFTKIFCVLWRPRNLKIFFMPAFGLELVSQALDLWAPGRLLVGLPVAKSRLRSGKRKPPAQKPSLLKFFCNSGFRKIKVFIRQR